MAKLPYSRTVLVTLSRNDKFPSRRGFGTAIYLTPQEVTGELDATHRTKLYASQEEVAADFDPADDFYKAALSAFAQNPRPVQIKAAFYDNSTGITGSELQTELDAIYNYDNDWYFLVPGVELRDIETVLGDLAAWIETKNKQCIIDSNDVGTYAQANTTCIAAILKNTVERTSVFFHTDATQHAAFAYAAYLSTFNFDEANSSYTGKFKKLQGIPAINLDSAKISAITGFTPQLGQSSATGHMANTIIDIGQQLFVVEGSTLSQNVFIDEIHSSDWIIARTEEQLLGILLNDKKVPYSDQGMQQLASAARTVMQLARRAGIVDDDIDPVTGKYKEAVIITVPSIFDVPESQRKNRIAPEITVQFRYTGAVHYTTIRYQMSF